MSWLRSPPPSSRVARTLLLALVEVRSTILFVQEWNAAEHQEVQALVACLLSQRLARSHFLPHRTTIRTVVGVEVEVFPVDQATVAHALQLMAPLALIVPRPVRRNARWNES